ncbi:hypothetical protein LCGC14_2400730, partial [marine sediment metagenome]
MKAYASVLVLLAAATSAAGDFVVEVWGNATLCHHKGTMRVVAGRTVEFDLSALPRRAKIQRAVLRASIQRRGYSQTVQVCTLEPGQAEPPDSAKALPLRSPLYRTFDVTGALRKWAKRGSGPFRVYFKFAPGWKRESTTLEIAFDGKAKQATPRVAELRGVHHDGQTFLTWKEHEDIMAGTGTVTIEKLEQKLLPLRRRQQ